MQAPRCHGHSPAPAHSHAGRPLSSSASRELITQAGTCVPLPLIHPDRTAEMRSSPSEKKKKSSLKQQKCSATCCQGSCRPGKEREKVPQISVESLPRTVNIFGSPQRTNASSSLAKSAVLKETDSRRMAGGHSVPCSVGDI